MLRLRQAIVVEGRYDKNKLAQLVDAQIIETHGFGIMKDRELLAFLRRVAEARGLIVLTDAYGAGFVIRNYLKGALPKDRVRHAYIPAIPGKERRKTAPGKEGILGVEGMTPELLLRVLEQAGASFDETPRSEITGADLYTLGLSGRPDSAKRRAALLKRLELPMHLHGNALLDALNLLFTREEFLRCMEENNG